MSGSDRTRAGKTRMINTLARKARNKCGCCCESLLRRACCHLMRRGMLDEKRVEQIFEGAASAQNARFYGADATFENFGDFLVAQPFQIAKDDRTTKHVGNLAERALH